MTTDSLDYFRDLRAQHEATAVPESRTAVIRRSIPEPAAHKHLGRSIRALLKRLDGWPRVSLGWSLVHITSEYRAADSKTKPGQEAPDHRKGEILRPAHDDRHWWLIAARPGGLALRAHWLEGTTPKGARSFGFQEALVVDPVGIPSELYVDYSVGNLPRVKDEPGHVYEERIQLAEYRARKRNIAYNDGASYLNHRPVFDSWKGFDAWLTEWEEMLSK